MYKHTYLGYEELSYCKKFALSITYSIAMDLGYILSRDGVKVYLDQGSHRPDYESFLCLCNLFMHFDVRPLMKPNYSMVKGRRSSDRFSVTLDFGYEIGLEKVIPVTAHDLPNLFLGQRSNRSDGLSVFYDGDRDVVITSCLTAIIQKLTGGSFRLVTFFWGNLVPESSKLAFHTKLVKPRYRLDDALSHSEFELVKGTRFIPNLRSQQRAGGILAGRWR